jgi:hypothetical protein
MSSRSSGRARLRSFAPGFASVLLASSVLLAAPSAKATDPFEIQVYEPDLNEPGHFGAELHVNYGLQGHKTPEYEGQIAPHHVGRMTLEPALGVTKWLELGAYLQSFVDSDFGVHWGGVKLRAKMVPYRKPGSPWFYGLNVEIGRVPKTVDAEGWANELRPIFGYDDGHWLFDVNPIFGYALSGPEKFRPELEPCAKAAWNTQRGFRLGLEYYSGLGLLNEGLTPRRLQEHMLYVVFDRANPAGNESDGWEVNVGLGRSLTDASPNTWSLKAIVGRAF